MGPRRAGDPPVLVAAVERAHEVLGWTAARTELEEMIGSAWEWRRRNLDIVTGQRVPPTP
jgi:UDP-glucose 4-epimerase